MKSYVMLITGMINNAKHREAHTSADSSAGSTLRARSKSTRTFRSSFIRQRKSAYLITKHGMKRQFILLSQRVIPQVHSISQQLTDPQLRIMAENWNPVNFVLTLAHRQAHECTSSALIRICYEPPTTNEVTRIQLNNQQ